MSPDGHAFTFVPAIPRAYACESLRSRNRVRLVLRLLFNDFTYACGVAATRFVVLNTVTLMLDICREDLLCDDSYSSVIGIVACGAFEVNYLVTIEV